MCDNNCDFTNNRTREHLLSHIHAKIPTKISPADIHLLPTRNDFCKSVLSNTFYDVIRQKKPLIFMPNDVTDKVDRIMGQSHQHMYVFGVLPCGSKTCVILKNFLVNIDIRVPRGMTSREFDAILRSRLDKENIQFSGIQDIKLQPLQGFSLDLADYKRVKFHTLYNRSQCIDMLKKQNISAKENGKTPWELADDDHGYDSRYYFAKIAREHRFATADWNRIENYEIMSPDLTTNCKYVIKVDVVNFQKLSDEKRQQLMRPGHPLAKILDKDPTVIDMWDIETYRKVQNGILPTPNDPDFTIFMICSAYFYQYSSTPFYSICCVDVATQRCPSISVLIECGTENAVLDSYIEAVGRMAPDIRGAFNGGNYDWPLVREKMRRANLLMKLKSRFSSIPLIKGGPYADTEAKVYAKSFKKVTIKIDAENVHVLECVGNFPGMLDVDISPVFRRLYPRAEVGLGASLNYYLTNNGLETKADMPYDRMFRIYERALTLRESTKCHCDNRCACCDNHVHDLDFKASDIKTNSYTNELLDEIVGKCCYCGKLPRNLLDMSEVAHYCHIDCVRPQQLCTKRMILADKRELSTMTFMGLYESYYRADGIKVLNVIGAYCNKYGIAFSIVALNKGNHEKDHFPGGWVFPPNRGLHSDGKMEITTITASGPVKQWIQCRPISGLDYASLYPSLMMTYNFSADRIVYTREEKDALEARGYTLHHIKPFEYERGEKKNQATNAKLIGEGWSVRHNGITDNKNKRIIIGYTKKEKYTLLVDNASISFETDNGLNPDQEALLRQSSKTTRSFSYTPQYGREALPGESIGICARVVKKFFDKRVPIKREFARLTMILEKMAGRGESEIEIEISGVKTVMNIEEIRFIRNKLESKQRGVKLICNTFYGKCGEFRSPIYNLLVAAGITTAGQINVKKASAFVINQGFIAHYGDTDSLYVSGPEHLFTDCDKVYHAALAAIDPGLDEEARQKVWATARLAWWTEQVSITMKAMMALSEAVDDFLMKDNGTRTLTMSYEEVGYPCSFNGKKKYILTPHIKTINFYPDEYMIKGIEIVKQGQTKVSKNLCYEFIGKLMSPENTLTQYDLVLNTIKTFYTIKYETSLFIITKKYKPTKDNKAVNKFVARMVETQNVYKDNPMLYALYAPPAPGDKFEYVVVKRNTLFNLRGNKIKTGVSDQMELVRIYEASQFTENPMEIDYTYYVEGGLTRLFARFITYHPAFQPPEGKYDLYNKEEYKLFDKHCVTAAEKFLNDYCRQVSGRTIGCNLGKKYKAVYRSTAQQATGILVEKYGEIGKTIKEFSFGMGCEKLQCDELMESLLAQADKDSKPWYNGKEFIQYMFATTSNTIYQIYHAFGNTRTGMLKNMMISCNANIDSTTSMMRKLATTFVVVINKYNTCVADLVSQIRDNDDSDGLGLEKVNDLSDEDYMAVEEIYEIYKDLVALLVLRKTTQSTIVALATERAIASNAIIEQPICIKSIAEESSRTAKVVAYQWE